MPPPSNEALRGIVQRSLARLILHESVHGLMRRYPEQCAAFGLAVWQKQTMAACAILIFIGTAVMPAFSALILSLALAAGLLPIVLLRLYAGASFRRPAPAPPPPTPDSALPVYTVLAPLYREANIVRELAASLARLDWPRDKLDIKLLLEASDAATIAAARALDLPRYIEIVVVPDGQPRTKPKALNYGLALARGDYVVIFDAEDRPEPDQLRRAYARFTAAPPSVACLQAKLGFYNARENWITRQFELEYAALFEGLLPALERLDLPIPLGGTSNHFRASVLHELGAWDAFNVTEDADLGMRLARRGHRCAVLESHTWEEAPNDFRNWTPQRTRWLKGYMQTYATHMRRPVRLWRELGAARFLGFQALFGGMILTALAHPLTHALVLWQAGWNAAFQPESWAGFLLLPATLIAGCAGYGGAMWLAWRSIIARRGRSSLTAVLGMPLYWLMVSAVSYRALWQFFACPFHWEKTRHGVTRLRQIGERT